jgi:uncharacterized membrane protein YhiD involved in acid resistance
MAELVMLFGIGFFVAALLGLLIVLYVHNRFARLRSVDQSHADVHQLEQKLAVTLEERSKLEREIAAMKRDVELTWLPSAWKAHYSVSGSATSPMR